MVVKVKVKTLEALEEEVIQVEEIKVASVEAKMVAAMVVSVAETLLEVIQVEEVVKTLEEVETAGLAQTKAPQQAPHQRNQVDMQEETKVAVEANMVMEREIRDFILPKAITIALLVVQGVYVLTLINAAERKEQQ